MRAPPRLRGGLTMRLFLLVLGLFMFAAGIVAMLESGLGLSPWDVLHQGLAEHTPLSFGQANIVVGIVVVVAAWRLGARIGVGTLANAVLVGAFVELLTALGPVDALSDSSLGIRIGLLVAGLVLMGAGTGFYLGADLGAGPRDSSDGRRRSAHSLSDRRRSRHDRGRRPAGRHSARRNIRHRHRRFRARHRPGRRGFLLAARTLTPRSSTAAFD